VVVGSHIRSLQVVAFVVKGVVRPVVLLEVEEPALSIVADTWLVARGYGLALVPVPVLMQEQRYWHASVHLN
jgi:hypothetical protein